MKLVITENQLKKIIVESMEMDLDEDYPLEWSIEEFKALDSFNKRVQYCNQKLKRISSGSSRIVYQIDDEKVLKLAKNKKGIAQNDVEIEYGQEHGLEGTLAKVFDSDPNGLWVEMELARKVRESDFKNIVGVEWRDAWRSFAYYDHTINGKQPIYGKPDNYDDLWENEFMYGVFGYIGDYGIPAGDLIKLSTFGKVTDSETGQENIVIIDYGLTGEVYDSYYS